MQLIIFIYVNVKQLNFQQVTVGTGNENGRKYSHFRSL